VEEGGAADGPESLGRVRSSTGFRSGPALSLNKGGIGEGLKEKLGKGEGAALGAAVGTWDFEDLPVPWAMAGKGLKGIPVEELGLQLRVGKDIQLHKPSN
jgi:hypothetical protein